MTRAQPVFLAGEHDAGVQVPWKPCGDGDNARVARTAADAVRRIGVKLAALAQDGLAYTADEYDRDRYRQVSRLAAESR